MSQTASQLQSPQTHSKHVVLECDSPLLGVEVKDGHRRLIAIRDIAKDTKVFYLEGRETNVPSRFSVQIGPSLHIDQDAALDEFDVVRRYHWRFLDHACEPSARIIGRELFAIRDIAAGEPVTFHYCTTEYDMATPFTCHCGSAHCLGLIRGARYLPPAERERLKPWMAEYLLQD